MRAQRLGSRRVKPLSADAVWGGGGDAGAGAGCATRSRLEAGSAARSAAGSGAHVRLEARPDLGLDRVDRVRGAHEERVEIGSAPGEVGDHLGDPQLADQLAGRRIDPHPARPGNPDVAARIAFHAVGQTGLALRDDAAGEHSPVHERAVRAHVEHADQRLHRIVDVEAMLVGREAQPIRLVEHVALDQQLRRPAAGRHAIDALKPELARPLDAVHRHAAIPRVGKIDRSVGFDAHVVGAVELVALEVRGQHLAPSVRALAHQARGGVLAHDQVQVLIVGHAVALVGGALDLAHAAALVPTSPHVGRHVREQQVMLDRMPDRALGEGEAGAHLADRRPAVDELLELSLHDDV